MSQGPFIIPEGGTARGAVCSSTPQTNLAFPCPRLHENYARRIVTSLPAISRGPMIRYHKLRGRPAEDVRPQNAFIRVCRFRNRDLSRITRSVVVNDGSPPTAKGILFPRQSRAESCAVAKRKSRFFRSINPEILHFSFPIVDVRLRRNKA